MCRTLRVLPPALLSVCLILSASRASAQSFDAVGVRAAGMAGAFTAVADDASAVYWNPAGLAAGSFFSLVIDRNVMESLPDDETSGTRDKGTLVAVGIPSLGLSYYRTSRVEGHQAVAGMPGQTLARVLQTDNIGATVLQTLTDGIVVGTTLRYVRGSASSLALIHGSSIEDDLDQVEELGRATTSKFDMDLGAKADLGPVHLGLTVRNLLEPDFQSPDGGSPMTLSRTLRAGAAYDVANGWIVALDSDLTRSDTVEGPWRDLAIGTERHLGPTAIRAGVRVNTAGGPAGTAPTVSLGATYRLWGSMLLDGQATKGADAASTGWGLGVRAVF